MSTDQPEPGHAGSGPAGSGATDPEPTEPSPAGSGATDPELTEPSPAGSGAAEAEPTEPSVRRVDDRLGLAVRRATLGPVTLVTYARDHVTVRTPSRPDFRDGNTLDLAAPPAPEDLPRWFDRYDDTIGTLGTPHAQVRWEEPLSPHATAPSKADPAAAVPTPDPALAEAAEALGLEVFAVTVLLLDELIPPERRPPAQLSPVEPPAAEPGGPVDRRWHAATVLYRYADGDAPVEWRDWESAFVDWSVEQQRQLATAGRCQVWIAMRHGAPVARLTVMHDRQGLAAVEDVVTHPVHRGLGIASGLTATAVAAHLEVYPGSRVGLGAEPGSDADRLYRRLGFRPHATVWTALRPDPRTRADG